MLLLADNRSGFAIGLRFVSTLVGIDGKRVSYQMYDDNFENNEDLIADFERILQELGVEAEGFEWRNGCYRALTSANFLDLQSLVLEVNRFLCIMF